jgi:hypothetical protein
LRSAGYSEEATNELMTQVAASGTPIEDALRWARDENRAIWPRPGADEPPCFWRLAAFTDLFDWAWELEREMLAGDRERPYIPGMRATAFLLAAMEHRWGPYR